MHYSATDNNRLNDFYMYENVPLLIKFYIIYNTDDKVPICLSAASSSILRCADETFGIFWAIEVW